MGIVSLAPVPCSAVTQRAPGQRLCVPTAAPAALLSNFAARQESVFSNVSMDGRPPSQSDDQKLMKTFTAQGAGIRGYFRYCPP